MTNNTFKQTEIGEIPEDWNIEELGKFAEKIGSGITPRGGSSVYQDSGTALIRSQNVYNNEFSLNGLAFIDDDIAHSMKNVELKSLDVLLNITGDSVARACIVPEHVLPARVNQHVSIIRTNRKMLNPMFLKYYLVSPKMQLRMLSMASAGATRKALTKGMIEAFLVPFPELDEQQQIASILSSLDDKIELNRRMNKTLEEIGKALFKQWFVDFEFPNENGEPYKSSGGEMVESELGEIPRAWKVQPLADVYDFLEGPGIRNWQYSDEGTRFINIRLINNGDIYVLSSNFINQDDVDNKYQHFLLEEGDMVVSTSGTLGRSAIVRKSHLPLLLNTSVIRFRPKKDVGYAFMYLYLQSEEFLNEQIRLSSGSVQKNFGPTHLKQMKIILPQKSLLDSFKTVGEGLYKQIVANMNESENLSKIRDSLLPRLMSGKIRVN